jgi:hypothetical protein
MRRKWRRFRVERKASFGKDLKHYFRQNKETGSFTKQKSSGRQGTSEENMEHIRESCITSPKMSISRRSLETTIPNSTVQNVIHKCLYDSAEAQKQT